MHCFLPRIRAKFATVCFAFEYAHSRISREFRANFARISHEYLHFSISSPSQEPWHCWLPDPRAVVAAQKRLRPAGHTSAPALPGTGTGTGMGTGTGGPVSFDVPSRSAGAPPADIRPAVPAPPPPAPGPDPVVIANPVAGTGATAYPSDLPPITTLSMLRTQPPFAWKLDLPGRKRAREVFVATTWEIEVETQDGAREPPLKISFPCAITHPKPGGGWKEGERVIALYAYRLRGGHWRMDCCVQGRAGVLVGQLRRLAALAVTGVRGWGDRVEEHMSYAWLQMLTRAKEEQRRHLGEVGGVVDVDAEGGEGEGDDASSVRSSRSGGSRGKVGRPRKAPKLPTKSGGQPSAAKPPPAAHVDAWVAAQAGAMPEWQKRAVAAEGEVLLLRGKLQEAKQRAQGVERRATAAERERDVLRAHARKPKPKPGQQQEVGGAAAGGSGGGGGGVSDGVKYLMAGSQAWKSTVQTYYARCLRCLRRLKRCVRVCT